jgi:hypothetical protein
MSMEARGPTEAAMLRTFRSAGRRASRAHRDQRFPAGSGSAASGTALCRPPRVFRAWRGHTRPWRSPRPAPRRRRPGRQGSGRQTGNTARPARAAAVRPRKCWGGAHTLPLVSRKGGRKLPAAMLWTRMLPDSLPDASRDPSWLKLRHVTAPVCPWRLVDMTRSGEGGDIGGWFRNGCTPEGWLRLRASRCSRHQSAQTARQP